MKLPAEHPQFTELKGWPHILTTISQNEATQKQEANSKPKHRVELKGWKWAGKPGSPLAAAGGGAGRGVRVSHEVAEPHESQGTSPCPCPLADTAVGSASRLAEALIAWREPLVASSVHALLSVSPFPCFFSSLIHPADALCPDCIFCSAPPLTFHPLLLFSPSPFFSGPVPFTLSFILFPAFELFLFMHPLPWVAVSFFSPTLFPLWHSALLYSKFLECVHSDTTHGFLCYRAT